jgi:hypothetical protein
MLALVDYLRRQCGRRVRLHWAAAVANLDQATRQAHATPWLCSGRKGWNGSPQS